MRPDPIFKNLQVIAVNIAKKSIKTVLLAPVLFYRYFISPFTPAACRHLPTCSDYTTEAIEKNGSWKGAWLGLSRILRCNPFGSHGHDPVPDLRKVKHPWAPWRYGRWTGKHITLTFDDDSGNKS